MQPSIPAVPEVIATPRVLDVLREKTRPMHAQLEEQFNLEHALSSPLEYRRLLESYLGFYRPFERMMARQPGEVTSLVGWPERRRTPWLESDLSALGVQASELAGVADCPSLPALDTLDAVLGACYVVEGSTLGGQVIYRLIGSRLGLDKASGAAFFYGDGADTAAAWKRFKTLLEGRVTDAGCAAEVAGAMFGAFEQWLCR